MGGAAWAFLFIFWLMMLGEPLYRRVMVVSLVFVFLFLGTSLVDMTVHMSEYAPEGISSAPPLEPSPTTKLALAMIPFFTVYVLIRARKEVRRDG